MIKILLADNHPIVRAGLKQILTQYDDLTVTDEAGTSQEIFNKIDTNNYDVILLDIAMPGRSGIEIIKDLKSEKPGTSVLVLTYYPEEHYAVRALKAGASGYLMKKSAPDELLEAIKTVSGGRKYLSASVAERLAYEVEQAGEKTPHERLSDREYQIMCMIARGQTVTAIAYELCLSVKTISTHRSRILKKMGMKNNAEIIYYAINKASTTYINIFVYSFKAQ